MICYKDMSFCSAAGKCKNSVNCPFHFDRMQQAKADLWAIECNFLDSEGHPAPPVAYIDFSKKCLMYEEKL